LLGKPLLYIKDINKKNLNFKVIKLIFQKTCLQWTSLNFTNASIFPIFKFFLNKKGRKLLDKWRFDERSPVFPFFKATEIILVE